MRRHWIRKVEQAVRLFTMIVVGWAVAGGPWVPCGAAAEKGQAAKGDHGMEVESQLSGERVECYDFFEVRLKVALPNGINPFTEASVAGEFEGGTPSRKVEVSGFCDSAQEGLFRVRFMPASIGEYRYRITIRSGRDKEESVGGFRAVPGNRKGLVRVDVEHPWHFVWEGTGEHYYLNGTTAFLLMGWENEGVIRECIDRLHRLEVNRIRVLLDGRTDHFWGEPIRPNAEFRACLNPWEAKRPESAKDPGFDYMRFNCAYWQKFERMVRYCRERDMVVSVILGWNDTKVHPEAWSLEEARYIQYAVARLAAFSNVTWDLGDDLDGFRDERWTHAIGSRVYAMDTYHHLATSHPVDNGHQDRASEWFGMTSFQQWNRPLHDWMLKQRKEQEATGRIIPQVNEEYGYEDHYPSWAPYRAPAANADADRRAAWEMAMAGCYQTTGETAKRGTGVPPDSGGGWVNGRGDGTMRMLEGYAHMVRFFRGIRWWELEPHDGLVGPGDFCLAKGEEIYVVYLTRGGQARVKTGAGNYRAKWFNPRDGTFSKCEGKSGGGEWVSPAAADEGDWVLLVERAS